MKKKYLTMTPTGGFGEIGMNCQLWDNGNVAFLIDCGVLFPDELQPGIDAVIPSMNAVIAVKDRLRGLIVTHGHEDHIGAIPWLIMTTEIPQLNIYASPFTLALIKRKLEEHQLTDKATLVPVAPRQTVQFDDIELTFIPVAHSIPQSYAIGINSPIGKFLHTGDFRFEDHPSDGVGTDVAAIKAFAGKNGVKALLCDSTNAEVPGAAMSESTVAKNFDEIFAHASRRIIITTFASHIERIKTIYRAAKKQNRTVIVCGRSFISNIEAAKDIPELADGIPDTIYTDQNMPFLAPEETVILATGSQGEQLSALARIVHGQHKDIIIEKDDTVILSARVIPGNALPVNRLINRLVYMGAVVFHPEHHPVHVSGHGHQEELKQMIRLTKPKYFIPMHGEFRHLDANKHLATGAGITEEHVLCLEDGEPVTFFPRSLKMEEKLPDTPILIDGKGIGDVGEMVLHERKLLSDNGLLTIVFVRDGLTGQLKYGPAISTKGLLFEETSQELLEEARVLTTETINENPNMDMQKLHDTLRSVLRSFFRRKLGRDPVVLPVIMVG